MPRSQPPFTPEEVLRRTLRLARVDGVSVIVVSGVFTIWALVDRDLIEAAAGLLICAAGAITLRGRSLLLSGRAHGVDWLIAGQIALIAVVESYLLWRLQTYDPDLIRRVAAPLVGSPLFAATGLTEAQLLRDLHSIHLSSYLIAAALVFLFQGGLALRYRRQRPILTQALAPSVGP